MGRRKPDDDLLELVFGALKTGATQAEVAAVVGVAPTTVTKWVANYAPPGYTTGRGLSPGVEARLKSEPPPKSELPSLEPMAALAVSADDSLARLKAMQSDLLRIADEARGVCNYRESQKAMRDAAGLAPVIARLERLGAEDSDVFRISRAEIATAVAGYRERVKVLLSRPLVCTHCGRQIAVAWGEGED